MTPDVAVIVPMLGRAHLMPTVRESLAATAGGRARIVWAISAGEHALVHEASTHGEQTVVLPPRVRGDYAAKINAGVRATDERWLFLGAGDIRFLPGWLEACEARLTPGIGVVGTNDLGNPRTADGRLSTHTFVTREYTRLGTIDDPGRLLHEGYWHEYVDDEFTQTAKARGAYAHAADAHVEHLHPDHGKRPADAVDANRDQRMVYGSRVFRSRRHLWMPPLS